MGSSFTPGPWTANGFTIEEVSEPSKVIGKAYGQNTTEEAEEYSGVSHTEGEANARLMAASPELLEACKKLLAVINLPNADIPDSNLNKKRYYTMAAIAKAEGN